MEKTFAENVKHYKDELKKYQLKYQQNTLIRLGLFTIGSTLIYVYYTTGYNFLWLPIIGIVILFFWLYKRDEQINKAKRKAAQLLLINEKELIFLQTNQSTYPNGEAFNDPTHLYATDLDIFGNNSLYQYLNRTATIMGSSNLANTLLNKTTIESTLQQQEAIKECATKLSFRQHIQALATLANDDKTKVEKIIAWSTSGYKAIPKLVNVLMIVLPILLFTTIVLYNVTDINNLQWVAILLFLINTYITAAFGKQLLQIIGSTQKINETISHYAGIIQLIEKEKFTSPKMIALQNELRSNNVQASKQLQQLAVIVNNIESIQNVFGALLVNGFTFFHLHQLNAFNKWKKTNDVAIQQWLTIIGEVEKINSLANFAYNNPEFCFPAITTTNEYHYQNLGHPLIHPTKRVVNTIHLAKQNFIILSGSNMSGKSTFLRTMGINIVLQNTGAPICATQATTGYLALVSCMRLSDSLAENTSYFFAEVQRLQRIVQQCSKATCFVLLDEILRGTNSTDKQEGTKKVIQKLLQQDAVGLIATHDVEVCNWGKAANPSIGLYCFENDIIDNELFFDYKLKQGICTNKTATFLLQKRGVIL